MKQIISISLALTFLITILNGCGGSGTPLPNQTGRSATITFTAVSTPAGFTPSVVSIDRFWFPSAIAMNTALDQSLINTPSSIAGGFFPNYSSSGKGRLTLAVYSQSGSGFPSGDLASLSFSVNDASMTEQTLYRNISSLNPVRRAVFSGISSGNSISGSAPFRFRLSMN